jgi:hypothetical protein
VELSFDAISGSLIGRCRCFPAFAPFQEVQLAIGVKPDQPFLVFRHMLVPSLIPPVIPAYRESSGFPFLDGSDDKTSPGFVVLIKAVIMGLRIPKIGEERLGILAIFHVLVNAHLRGRREAVDRVMARLACNADWQSKCIQENLASPWFPDVGMARLNVDWIPPAAFILLPGRSPESEEGCLDTTKAAKDAGRAQ